MSKKEEIEYFEYLKARLIRRSTTKNTNSGFRQIMKALDKFNAEIKKLEKTPNDSSNTKR